MWFCRRQCADPSLYIYIYCIYLCGEGWEFSVVSIPKVNKNLKSLNLKRRLISFPIKQYNIPPELPDVQNPSRKNFHCQKNSSENSIMKRILNENHHSDWLEMS
ncbi:hypothetical protein XENTR_v10004697 [Xenopus tropicalis]|uniref:Uncharacterized protein n=1 Tax=Xenopus tropicalis TaxID=8364 RepID=A0A1B8Y6J4_XENTR|nr:hypothetical protein XENTR_v10004697 [Xenopus tropicalis]